MKDDVFWCVYFLLVFNKTGNILLDGNDNQPPKSLQNNHQTPQDVEEYFEKLYAQQVAEYPNSDTIIEPEEDNYFSPHKLKYNRQTNYDDQGNDEAID